MSGTLLLSSLLGSVTACGGFNLGCATACWVITCRVIKRRTMGTSRVGKTPDCGRCKGQRLGRATQPRSERPRPKLCWVQCSGIRSGFIVRRETCQTKRVSHAAPISRCFSSSAPHPLRLALGRGPPFSKVFAFNTLTAKYCGKWT